MYSNYRKCLICGSDEKYNAEIGTFNGLTKVRCIICGFVFANPIPPKKEYDSWYTLDTFWVKEQKRLGHPTIYDRIEHDYKIAENRVKYISRYFDPSKEKDYKYTMIDIGCGNGAFVRKARENKFNCIGIEMYENVCKIASRVAKTEIYAGTLETLKFEKEAFDIVVANDIIEHCYDPILFFNESQRILKPGGLLVLEFPDRESQEAKGQGLEWRHYKYKEHLYLFSLEDIKKLLTNEGFVIKNSFRPVPAKLSVYALKKRT